jgi:GTP cyclohydrolase IA
MNKEEQIVRDMLIAIGENTTRVGLVDTPQRVAQMWKEIFRGYNPEHKPKITVFPNGCDGIEYDEMIVDTGAFSSYCEHHMALFTGRYVFAYIPGKTIIGLSKVARVVDYYSARLQVQERLTTEIVDELEKALHPKGIALFMEAEHSCKAIRGVKKKGLMKTSCVRGVFKTKPEVRAEFFSMVNGGGGYA